jgi:hypothetical protein
MAVAVAVVVVDGCGCDWLAALIALMGLKVRLG